MTEPNDLGFYIFPDEPSCNHWIESARVGGAEDPMVVAVTDDTMVPRPRGWGDIKKHSAIQFRRLVDDTLAKARGKDGPEYAGMKYFGFMQNGELVAGAVQWKAGTMVWGDDIKKPTPEQLAKWARREQNGAATGGGVHTEDKTLASPAAPTLTQAHFTRDLMHHTPPLPTPTPGFETYEMRGERLIVAAPGLDPVMLVVRDGKIALKKLA